jgi:hypothetical protein
MKSISDIYHLRTAFELYTIAMVYQAKWVSLYKSAFPDNNCLA